VVCSSRRRYRVEKERGYHGRVERLQEGAVHGQQGVSDSLRQECQGPVDAAVVAEHAVREVGLYLPGYPEGVIPDLPYEEQVHGMVSGDTIQAGVDPAAHKDQEQDREYHEDPDRHCHSAFACM
jgi:hypothetical protein